MNPNTIFETVTNPITGVGRVAINATVDKFTLTQCGVDLASPEATVKRYEPVYIAPDMASNANFARLGGGTDNGVRVLSHVPDKYFKDKTFLDKLIFVGFADGDVDPSQGPADIAVRIGGLATVINTSHTTIPRGSFVCYGAPVEGGKWMSRPGGKRLLSVCPLVYKDDAVIAEVNTADMKFAGDDVKKMKIHENVAAKIAKEVASDGKKTKEDQEKEIDARTVQFRKIIAANRAIMQARKRIIGRALTHAEPGKPLDILLGGYAI